MTNRIRVPNNRGMRWGWVKTGVVLGVWAGASLAAKPQSLAGAPQATLVTNDIKGWETTYSNWLKSWFEKQNLALNEEVEAFRDFWNKEYALAEAFKEPAKVQVAKAYINAHVSYERTFMLKWSQELVEEFNRRNDLRKNLTLEVLRKNQASAMSTIGSRIESERYQNTYREEGWLTERRKEHLAWASRYISLAFWSDTPPAQTKIPTEHEGQPAILEFVWGGAPLSATHYAFGPLHKAIDLLKAGQADPELVIDRLGDLWFRNQKLQLRLVVSKLTQSPVGPTYTTYETITAPEVTDALHAHLREVLGRKRLLEKLRNTRG